MSADEGTGLAGRRPLSVVLAGGGTSRACRTCPCPRRRARPGRPGHDDHRARHGTRAGDQGRPGAGLPARAHPGGAAPARAAPRARYPAGPAGPRGARRRCDPRPGRRRRGGRLRRVRRHSRPIWPLGGVGSRSSCTRRTRSRAWPTALGARLTRYVATGQPGTLLPHAQHVGIPLRRSIAELDRAAVDLGRASTSACFPGCRRCSCRAARRAPGDSTWRSARRRSGSPVPASRCCTSRGRGTWRDVAARHGADRRTAVRRVFRSSTAWTSLTLPRT